MQKTQKQKMPVGIILILIYLGFGILGSLQSLFNPAIQIGPKVLTGIIAVLPILIMLTLQAFLFYGLIKRAKWARTLGIVWYTLLIALGIANIIFLTSNTSLYDNYLSTMLPTNSEVSYSEILQAIIVIAIIVAIIILMLSTIILIYFIRKKEYFVK